MNNDFNREEALFEEAVKRTSEAERVAFLEEACSGNPDLRARLDLLLEGYFKAGRFLSGGPESRSGCDDEAIGSVIGRYKVLERIGEGGFGVVYLAEQKEPVKRRVALKVIKLGMDTKQVVARFEAERQVLALMDHPNIAKVHDGGATEAGRPYFVMELVRGVPITNYCTENELSTRERLDLFIQVCQAVQHAHQKGIIHRDLKPSNILVTVNDGVAVPKVIDFGVAKATQLELTEKTIFTHFHQFIGTPAYMSPEQAQMTSVDIDTRSDVYSLGVLLYELLTGKTPFEGKELLALGLDEMRRTIREKEPMRPSTRLARGRAAAKASVNTFQAIESDLDWIVMKCLEKDRARRYETANGLATDLKRHLNNEPVTARPQSGAYRFQKLVRRHKLQFAAATTVAMVLIAATVVSSWQAVRASRAERVAREQAAVAVAVKEFLSEQVLKTTSPYVDTTGDPNRRAVLERVGRQLDGRFAEQPRIEAELRLALAKAFDGWDDYPNALVHAQRARELLLALPGYGPTHSDTLKATAWIATAYTRLGQEDLGDKLRDETLELVRKTRQPASAGFGVLLTGKAFRLVQQGKFEESLVIGNQALVMLRETMGPEDAVSGAMYSIAFATAKLGPFEKGAQSWAESAKAVQEAYGENHPTVAMFLRAHGLYCQSNGRMDEARTLLERAVALQKRTLPSNHYFLIQDENALADLYQQIGETNRALEIYRTLPSRLEPHLSLVAARKRVIGAADLLSTRGLMEEARAAARILHGYYASHPPVNDQDFLYALRAAAGTDGWPAAAELCRRDFDDFSDSLSTWLTKAWIFRHTGDEERYRQVVERVLGLAPTARGVEDQRLILEIAALGPNRFSDAQVDLLDSLMTALQAAKTGPATDQQRRSYRVIAHLQLQLGRHQSCLEALEKAASNQTTPDAYALFIKALCLHRLGRSDEAREAFKQAEAIVQRVLPEPLSESEPFLPAWQAYRQVVLRREVQAALDGIGPQR